MEYGTSLTVLYSQPVSGLQIRDENAKWRWVSQAHGQCAGRELWSHRRNALRRILQIFSSPRGHPRTTGVGTHVWEYSIFYYPGDDVRLAPLSESPVLQRVGTKRRVEEGLEPLVGAWRSTWVASYGKTELKESSEEGIEEEEMQGIRVKHYN
ncbi:hypothetical protein F5148DRAFT_694120 [Russula earlei]|uniref:Uncharacterized protein n=1 Tax=Russula earlei TaxID=71964 RepID=A0ACC0UE52_9AGAM|nr:hypothetical protein F5148DRAFT_694120 [Russula earlei]